MNKPPIQQVQEPAGITAVEAHDWLMSRPMFTDTRALHLTAQQEECYKRSVFYRVYVSYSKQTYALWVVSTPEIDRWPTNTFSNPTVKRSLEQVMQFCLINRIPVFRGQERLL